MIHRAKDVMLWKYVKDSSRGTQSELYEGILDHGRLSALRDIKRRIGISG